MGSSLKDLKGFPDEVREEFGYGLYLAQTGGKHVAAKPMKGYHGSGVLEIVEVHDGSTYRAVYTVKFAGTVYVLHAFQKKSVSGIATPKPDIDVVNVRLKQAKEYERDRKQREKKARPK